jgi:hypothetical protein
VDGVMPGTAAGWVARRLPVADDDHRDELAESVASAVAGRPACDRAWEAAGLLGLWLRLWGRREGRDDARRALRQGVYLGGVVLMFAASALAWSRATHASASADGLGADAPGSVSAFGGAALASGAAVLAAGGWRRSALVVVIGSLVACTFAAGTPPAVVVVGALAVLAGDRFGGRRCWRGLAAGALVAAVLAAVAGLASAVLLPVGAAVAFAGLPVGFLAVGWFDPRFAVAATVTWLGTMVAAAALAWPRVVGGGAWVPGRHGWWAMAAAVVVAAHVSRSALRRAFMV